MQNEMILMPNLCAPGISSRIRILSAQCLAYVTILTMSTPTEPVFTKIDHNFGGASLRPLQYLGLLWVCKTWLAACEIPWRLSATVHSFFTYGFLHSVAKMSSAFFHIPQHLIAPLEFDNRHGFSLWAHQPYGLSIL